VDEVLSTARRLAFETKRPDEPVRLLGVTVSMLLPAGSTYQPRLEFN
jgi:hypothetical protein